MVAEIFSPPRVVKHLSRFPNAQLVPGFSLDLTCLDPSDGKPWNFDLKAKRDKALHMVRTLQPLFLIGSPPCTHWSSWQALNVSKPGHDTEVTRRARIQALVHLRFTMMLCQEQANAGRYFIHEHPETARSWSEECSRKS